jgi:hypothetical protein
LKDHQSQGLLKSDQNETLRTDTPMYLGYEDEVKPGEIQGLIILDRSIDLVTPFCVQQTYEGMIDEHIGI